MLPTEPIGSIPRPAALIEGVQGFRAGRISQPELNALYDSAVQDTVQRLEATGSPVITDGEQAKHSFATYSIPGLENLSPDGVPILFADGHIRSFPRLTSGPFRYKTPADVYLEMAQRYAHVPLKQAVVSASALSLLYPQGGIPGYSRDEYLDALVAEQEGEIRRCLKKGAHVVQMDFTEGRLSIKLDPTRRLLHSFIDLNNLVLERFSAEERKRIGVHTCPGADRHSTHSADVDYAELLPSLFELQATNFCVQLASEPDRKRVLRMIRNHVRDGQRIFVGVILDRLNRRLRTLCQCTSTFFQAESEQELLQSLCEILVAGGECRLAWIGYCEDDADKTIRPVAQVGSGLEYLERVKTSWGEMEAGQGPAGMAARTGEACCVADIRTDTRFSLWRRAAPAGGRALR